MMDGLQLTIHMRFSLETQLQRLHEQLDKLATQEAERRQYQQTLEALHPLGREE
jgi:cell shape-determining protein MreC